MLMLDFSFSFRLSMSTREKILLYSILMFCLQKNTNMISIKSDELIRLFPGCCPDKLLLKFTSKCTIEFKDTSVLKYKILGQKNLVGQFFSCSFIDSNETIFFVLNPSFFKLLQELDHSILCSKIFLSNAVYSQYIFSLILENNGSNQIEISASDIKANFSFTRASWKSFLHRLPATEKALKTCGFFDDCNINMTHKSIPGAPIYLICIKYHLSNLEWSKELLSSFTAYNPIIGYSDFYKAFIVDGEFCESCGGLVLLKKDKYDHLFLCCSNSVYWNLGSNTCNFRNYHCTK